MTQTRREVILLGAAAAMAASAAGLAWLREPAEVLAPAAKERLLALLADREAAGALGAMASGLSTGKAETGILARLGEDAVLSADEPALRSRMEAAIADDFIAGRTIDVDGWVLSETEAQLYFLAAPAS